MTKGQTAFALILLVSSEPLHKQFFLYLSICSLTVTCIEKVLMKNVGRAVKTEFVSYNLLAWERKVDVLTRPLSHLLTMGRNSSTFGFVRPRGSPRYVKGREPVEQPKVLARWHNLS